MILLSSLLHNHLNVVERRNIEEKSFERRESFAGRKCGLSPSEGPDGRSASDAGPFAKLMFCAQRHRRAWRRLPPSSDVKNTKKQICILEPSSLSSHKLSSCPSNNRIHGNRVCITAVIYSQWQKYGLRSRKYINAWTIPGVTAVLSWI